MDARSPASSRTAALGPIAGLLAAIALVVTGCNTVVAPTASPVSSPAAVATPQPSPTPTVRPTPSPTPIPTPTPTPIASETASLEPGASPTGAGSGGLVSPCPGSEPTSHDVAAAVPGQSRNWSGYVASGTKEFDCVEATWIQPTIGCTSSATVSAVYWVGLGGYGQEALIQIGTESTCTQGDASAAVWRQSLPDERFSIRASLKISAGDRIWAQVRWLSGSRYRLALSDLTTRGHFAIEITNTALKRSSAEWIVESPSGGCPDHCRTLKMPNFSTFRFRTAWATIGGVRRQVDAAPAEHTLETMVTGTGAVRAEVTSTSADGTSFAVRWRRP